MRPNNSIDKILMYETFCDILHHTLAKFKNGRLGLGNAIIPIGNISGSRYLVQYRDSDNIIRVI